MLILGEKDVLSAASPDEVMAAIEESLKIYEEKNYYQPHRFHVDYKGKNIVYMPCIVGDQLLGTKYATIFPENIGLGVPSLYGLMILNDYTTGKPLCVMNGSALTSMRTGAVGGTGIRHTTPEDITSVGLVGAGVQGHYQLMYAARVRPIKEINIFDAYSKNMDGFVNRLKSVIPAGIQVNVCADTRELVKKSQLVITTTTATSPVLPDDPELLKGRHYIGVGSYKPDMREYPDALFKVVDHVFIDAEIAVEESGDLSQPLASGLLTQDRISSFGSYLLHEKDKDRFKRGTTFFKTVGIGIFDVVVANIIYSRAQNNGSGQQMEF